jgi:hypothetical protein
VGEAGPAALHAVALEPDLFASLTLRRSLVSWSNVVHTPVTQGALINCVHGALKTYDLPDLVSLAGPARVTVEEPVDARGQVIRRGPSAGGPVRGERTSATPPATIRVSPGLLNTWLPRAGSRFPAAAKPPRTPRSQSPESARPTAPITAG